MDKASKSELLTTIEAQREKLHRYEAKMRDLIAAYKSTINENEALKSSLAALTMTPSEARIAEPGSRKGEGNAVVTDSQSANQSENAMETVEKEVEPKQSDQITMLTSSLMTLTQEKTKMETAYQSEIKKLRQEAEDKEKKVLEDKCILEKLIQGLETEVQELKKRSKYQHVEREREQNDHAVMMRELQKIVASERMAKENIEQQLADARMHLAEKDQAHSAVCKDYERRIASLDKEVAKHVETVRALEVKGEQPSADFVKLQDEIAQYKEQQKAALNVEHARIRELEEHLQAVRHDKEKVVTALEARIAELSDSLVQNERVKQQDVEAIRRLREQAAHLTTENNTLSTLMQQQQQHVGKSITEIVAEDLNQATDAQTLLMKMLRLKDVIRESSRRFESAFNDELLEDSTLILGLSSETLHGKCRQQLEDLREEYERYKLRAQSILKNKGNKCAEGPSQKEYDQLKVQILEWREKVQHLRAECDELKMQLSEKDRQHSQTINALTERHKVQLAAAESEYKAKIAELETEMKRHRERTISLLAEKNQELESIRLESQYVSRLHQLTPPPPAISNYDANSEAAGASSGESSAVTELLARSPHSSSVTGSENSLLHFAHEQARKDIEISTLHKQKRSLEQALRELQQSVAMKDERHVNEIERLNELLDRYERNKSRESANLEYLKNVIYHYMIEYDRESRQRMLNAIATILQFNPKEKSTVQEHLQSGMWLAAYGKKS